MRLIDADAAIEELEREGKAPVFYSNYERRIHADKVAFAIHAMEEAPTAGELVRHAEWVFDKNINNHRCSSCGQEALGNPNMICADIIVTVSSEFCPHCGAKMDGGKNR